jgi:16S rRNA (adenine1518-N6/adenine1519-N6)-dimethyltransferase
MSTQIKTLLKKYGVFPSKKLGQNFLINKNFLRKIAEIAEIEGESVLEIGAGIGNLTEKLVKRAKKVLVVEKDKRMIRILKEKFKNFRNVEIIEGDIRDCLEKLSKKLKNFKIVANIPYYLTSNLLRRIFELENKPKEIILMVQKEVAQRIVAKAPEMNLLAISVQLEAKPKIICYVSRNCFWPKPKVDSAIIKISSIKSQMSKPEKDLFFKIVKSGFSHPRKKLINNFSKKLKLDKEKIKKWLIQNKISLNVRAENLSLKDWLNLTKSYKMLV